MADSQEMEPQLNAFAQETVHHRYAVIAAAVKNIGEANVPYRNVVELNAYRPETQALAQLATSSETNTVTNLDAYRAEKQDRSETVASNTTNNQGRLSA